MYYIENKSIEYYLELLLEDAYYYIMSIARHDVPVILLVVFSFLYLLVPLTKIDKSDYISGLLYVAFGMFNTSLVVYFPSDYLKSRKDFMTLTIYLILLSIPPLYIWFHKYKEVIVTDKPVKKIDYELTHANDKFEEAENEKRQQIQ